MYRPYVAVNILSPKLTLVEKKTGDGCWEFEPRVIGNGRNGLSFTGMFPPKELLGAFGSGVCCVLS